MQLLNAELKAKFDRDGYAFLPAWLNADELQKIKGEVDRFLRDGVPSLPPGAAVREGTICAASRRLQQRPAPPPRSSILAI